MHIEYMRTRSPKRAESQCAWGGRKMPFPGDVEDYLVALDGTMHNGRATQLLCAASMWAYSDLKTFASLMCHRGLYGEFVSINVTNHPAFVDTTAFLFLSYTKTLALLAFRGTEPLNLVNWLADANTTLVPQEEGGIHSGFLAASIVLMPVLERLLLAWSDPTKPRNLRDGLVMLSEDACFPNELIMGPLNRWQKSEREIRAGNLTKLAGVDDRAVLPPVTLTEEAMEDRREKEANPPKPALYICGHSLGGAMAAMAAAMLLDPRFKPIRARLRSVYTFGAPMFTDEVYADTLHRTLGDRVFRHRFGKDVVPLLPGTRLGSFKHFGVGYVNSPAGVWERAKSDNAPVAWSSLAILISMLAWLKETGNILPRLSLPYSITDHYPLRYLRTSQAPRAGWEILGWELGGGVPGT
jgi:pimeloyl-ACP methyl ester carboxylesterase